MQTTRCRIPCQSQACSLLINAAASPESMISSLESPPELQAGSSQCTQTQDTACIPSVCQLTYIGLKLYPVDLHTSFCFRRKASSKLTMLSCRKLRNILTSRRVVFRTTSSSTFMQQAFWSQGAYEYHRPGIRASNRTITFFELLDCHYSSCLLVSTFQDNSICTFSHNPHHFVLVHQAGHFRTETNVA